MPSNDTSSETFQVPIAGGKYVLIISTDYGTNNLAVSWRIPYVVDGPQAEDPQLSDLNTLPFGGKGIEYPQEVAWDAEGNFIWGHAVKDAIERGQISHGDVIELWKLCLCPDLATSHIAERVNAQLEAKGKTLDDLIHQHVAAIVRHTKDTLKRSRSGLKFSQQVSCIIVAPLPVCIDLHFPGHRRNASPPIPQRTTNVDGARQSSNDKRSQSSRRCPRGSVLRAAERDSVHAGRCCL